MSLYFRSKPLPALEEEAQRQVVDEFRRLTAWTEQVRNELSKRPWFDSSDDCPEIDGAIPYFECETDTFKSTGNVYSLDTGNGNPGIIHGIADVYPIDKFLEFETDVGGPLGGIGNPYTLLGVNALLLVGTEELADWENLSRRAPVAFGGSKVLIDAGSSMVMRLPGVVENDYGYSLQIASDGESVVAAPNPAPDDEWSATSDSDGATLVSGTAATAWADFPGGLEVTLLNGTEAGLAVVNVLIHVENTSSRSGNIDIGISIDKADPLPAQQKNYIVAPNLVGAFTLSLLISVKELTADYVLSVMTKGQGDHNQFNLATDNSEGLHSLDVTITRGGGGGGSVPAAIGYGGVGFYTRPDGYGPPDIEYPEFGDQYLITADIDTWTPIIPPDGVLFNGSTDVSLVNGELHVTGSPNRVQLFTNLYALTGVNSNSNFLWRILRDGTVVMGGVQGMRGAEVVVQDNDYRINVSMSSVDCVPSTNPVYVVEILGTEGLSLDVHSFSFWLSFD